MRITYKGDYALKAVLYLALRYDGKNVATIYELAKNLDIPIKFLEQVLLELKRGGFVESRRGKAGGYLLAREPRQIKLGQVIRFIDGPVWPIACVEKKYSGCADKFNCVFKNIWQEITQGIDKLIDNITFEDLKNRVKTKEEILVYSI